MPIKPGTIYIAGEPEEIGTFPIRQEIEILPGDPPRSPYNHIFISSKGKIYKKKPLIGFRVFEKIGIAVVNPRGVLAGKNALL